MILLIMIYFTISIILVFIIYDKFEEEKIPFESEYIIAIMLVFILWPIILPVTFLYNKH